jgi:hypothetical protein
MRFDLLTEREWTLSDTAVTKGQERSLRIPYLIRHNIAFWALLGNQSKGHWGGYSAYS